MQELSENIFRILICPSCGQKLARCEAGASCQQCQLTYLCTQSGSLDLRLQKPRQYSLEFELGTQLSAANGLTFTPFPDNPNPEVDFSNSPVPFHISKKLLSYFPRAKEKNSLMLDLGCGGTIHREVSEFAGFEYVGLDYDAQLAPILGDGHALPFQDESFEFILSIAVLEHIRYPFVMTKEAYRVLKPGGKFIGTVAFLEPFHMNSFYHHTHLGTLNSLEFAGFQVEMVAPNSGWTALKALSIMSLFTRMPPRMAARIVAPVQWLHNGWWRMRRLKNKNLDMNEAVRDTTGAFTFIVTK